MSHAKNKVEWCLKKAKKELEKERKHRGLIKEKPNMEKARAHVAKAEYYFKATKYLKKGNFGVISTSTVFYCMYHCLLAILAKFGYFSRNQECTFAVIQSLIENKEINLNLNLLNRVASLDVKYQEETTLEIREHYQYDTDISLRDENEYKDLLELAQNIIDK